MHPFLSHFLIGFGSAGAFVLLFSLFLTFFGKHLGDWIIRAPALDLTVALMTWIPWLACGIPLGWGGFWGAVLGEVAALLIWCAIHEQANREALRGPRIVKFVNRTVGRWQNHMALWVTAVALPVFWGIRIAEIFLYPLLPLLLKFPKYDQAEWINVSRQKFNGLIGHDLIWCLYCDWMTGVYSLGAEMLRNVESFWCPIRYYDGKKCDHCDIEFPDINNGWVRAEGDMAEVETVMQDKYGHGNHSWFGHPTRLTVKGKEV
jgi:hypothetical protein